MKKTIAILCSLAVAFVVACNCAVLVMSTRACYGTTKDIPHCDYGILFGTGRSSAPSPYYQARIEAAIDLLQAKKVSALIISGENQYSDYNEVDSMAADIRAAVPNAEIYLDYEGTNTIASLKNAGDKFGYRSMYTMVSQHFHNQRAIYYGSLLFDNIPSAFDAADTRQWGWKLRNEIREILARTKCVIMTPSVVSIDRNDFKRPFIMDIADSIKCTPSHSRVNYMNHTWRIEGDPSTFPFVAITQTDDMQIYDSLKEKMERDMPGKIVYDKVDIPYYKDEKTNDTLFPDDAWEHAYAYANWYYAGMYIAIIYHAEEHMTQICFDSLKNVENTH